MRGGIRTFSVIIRWKGLSGIDLSLVVGTPRGRPCVLIEDEFLNGRELTANVFSADWASEAGLSRDREAESLFLGTFVDGLNHNYIIAQGE